MAEQRDLHSGERYVPTVLTGIEGEPPTYVGVHVADSPEAALAYAAESGEAVAYAIESGELLRVSRVLMRELDPIACKIRGVDEGWWVECTARSKKAEPFWRIDE